MGHSETDELGDESRSVGSRAVKSLKARTRDGSIPLVAGATLLVRTLRTRTNRNSSVGRFLAAAALIGIGIRQRRYHSETADSSTGSRGVTGTSEQRADSHRGDENPRGTATDPEIDRDENSEEESIQFTEHQGESETNPDLDGSPDSDPRIRGDETRRRSISRKRRWPTRRARPPAPVLSSLSPHRPTLPNRRRQRPRTNPRPKTASQATQTKGTIRRRDWSTRTLAVGTNGTDALQTLHATAGTTARGRAADQRT